MWANDLFSAIADDLVLASKNGVTYIKEQASNLSDSATKSVQWIWETLQGDFNEDQTVGQIAANAALGLVPIVDQVLDCRDLIANCRKINQNSKDSTAWLALCLTLIGLFPSLGSAAKGVLKICFLYLRKGGGTVAQLLAPAIKPIIAFLSDSKVQYILGIKNVSEGLTLAAKGVRDIQSRVNAWALLELFDSAIVALKGVVNKISLLAPANVKTWLTQSLELVQSIRNQADFAIAQVISPLQKQLDEMAVYLEKEAITQAPSAAGQVAQTGVKNVHTLVNGIDPAIVRTMSNAKKGLYGEIISDQRMTAKGHKNLLPADRIKRSLDDTPTGRGIDGIYQNVKPPPPYIITEVKYRTNTGQYIDSDGSSSSSLLSTTKDGTTQMSDRWIRRNLSDGLKNEELALTISEEGYARWLILVGPEGAIEQITVLDSAAKAIGKIEP